MWLTARILLLLLVVLLLSLVVVGVLVVLVLLRGLHVLHLVGHILHHLLVGVHLSVVLVLLLHLVLHLLGQLRRVLIASRHVLLGREVAAVSLLDGGDLLGGRVVIALLHGAHELELLGIGLGGLGAELLVLLGHLLLHVDQLALHLLELVLLGAFRLRLGLLFVRGGLALGDVLVRLGLLHAHHGVELLHAWLGWRLLGLLGLLRLLLGGHGLSRLRLSLRLRWESFSD